MSLDGKAKTLSGASEVVMRKSKSVDFFSSSGYSGRFKAWKAWVGVQAFRGQWGQKSIFGASQHIANGDLYRRTEYSMVRNVYIDECSIRSDGVYGVRCRRPFCRDKDENALGVVVDQSCIPHSHLLIAK